MVSDNWSKQLHVFHCSYVGYGTAFFQGNLSYVVKTGLAFTSGRKHNWKPRHKHNNPNFTLKKEKNGHYSSISTWINNFSFPWSCAYKCSSLAVWKLNTANVSHSERLLYSQWRSSFQLLSRVVKRDWELLLSCSWAWTGVYFHSTCISRAWACIFCAPERTRTKSPLTGQINSRRWTENTCIYHLLTLSRVTSFLS